jgi:hypothetical protein
MATAGRCLRLLVVPQSSLILPSYDIRPLPAGAEPVAKRKDRQSMHHL